VKSQGSYARKKGRDTVRGDLRPCNEKVIGMGRGLRFKGGLEKDVTTVTPHEITLEKSSERQGVLIQEEAGSVEKETSGKKGGDRRSKVQFFLRVSGRISGNGRKGVVRSSKTIGKEGACGSRRDVCVPT